MQKSKFRQIVEKILLETRVIRLPNPWNTDEQFSILENPSPADYESFLKNTKFGAIRGVSIDNNIYIADADVGMHDNIIETLRDSDKVSSNSPEAMFEDDLNSNFTIRGTVTPRIQKTFNNRLNMPKNISTNKLSYFDLESIFETVCVFEDEEQIAKLNNEYGIDFNNFRPGHKDACQNKEQLKQKLDHLITNS